MPQDKIVIYGHQASRASRPYWLLREYGMQIHEHFIEVHTGGPVTGFNDVRDSAEYLRLNPYRLIPTLVHETWCSTKAKRSASTSPNTWTGR